MRAKNAHMGAFKKGAYTGRFFAGNLFAEIIGRPRSFFFRLGARGVRDGLFPDAMVAVAKLALSVRSQWLRSLHLPTDCFATRVGALASVPP